MTKSPPASQAIFLEQVKSWPIFPGVYQMRDAAKRILYVGKAKNLRNRIRSYFQNWEGLTVKTRVLVRKVHSIEFTVTQTELEALLLECNLIKKHRPRYNIRLKDDKNFPYVVMDFTHPFPQFRISRKIVHSPDLKYFGPYNTGVRDLSRFLLKTFQIRDCSDSKFKNRSRPCLNYEIGTCTAPCVDLVSEEDYAKQVNEACLFLKGKTKKLVSRLTQEMSEASERTDFETASIIRDRIFSIERISEKQNAVLPDQTKNIDVIGRYIQGNDMQWVVLFIRAGFLIGRRTEKVTSVVETEDEATQSFLEQFYTLTLTPDEIWMATDFPNRKEIESLLSEKAKKSLKIKVKRDEKGLRLLGTAQENARLIYLENAKGKSQSASEELKQSLNLIEPPYSIEGIDVSNFQGEQPAVALVHFANETPLKSQYRVYHPKTIEGANDFGMIYETVMRRLDDLEGHPPPDLFMIDGGKGQLNAALKAMKEVGVEIPVCSLAKARTQSAFTLKQVERSEERIFVPGRKNPIILKENNPALRLLQRVRDEAHRFSVKNHRRRRTADSHANPMLEIPGIGPKSKEKLLIKFESVENLKEATVEEIVAAGIGKKTAKKVLDYLGGTNSKSAKT